MMGERVLMMMAERHARKAGCDAEQKVRVMEAFGLSDSEREALADPLRRMDLPDIPPEWELALLAGALYLPRWDQLKAIEAEAKSRTVDA